MTNEILREMIKILFSNMLLVVRRSPSPLQRVSSRLTRSLFFDMELTELGVDSLHCPRYFSSVEVRRPLASASTIGWRLTLSDTPSAYPVEVVPSCLPATSSTFFSRSPSLEPSETGTSLV